MRKAMLFLMISAGCLSGCGDHGSFDGPEIVAPMIGYMQVDSVLGYNRHVSLDLDSDAKPDLYFSSVLVMENDESCLYLNVRAAGGSGTRILTAKNPQLVSGGRWAYPLAAGALIGEKTDFHAGWSAPAQNAALLRIVDGQWPQFSGPWLGKTDQYIGFRKTCNGKEQYGWVRVSHKFGQKQLKIKDMGVMLMPEKAISAGHRNPF